MLAMGSELGATQSGNNNAYAQDNALSWLDWAGADTSLIDVATTLVALRKAHSALREDRFLDGAPHDATLIRDVEWLRADGAPMQEGDWRDGAAQTLIAALYAESDRVVVILHRGADQIVVTPPPPREQHGWRLAFDSARDDANDEIDATLAVEPRSVALLIEEKRAQRRAPPPAPDELLSRLAHAAGIETQWRDVEGATHDAPRETANELLARLGLPAETLHEARASLARLADERDRRALPASLTAREGETVTLRLSARDGRTPSVDHCDARRRKRNAHRLARRERDADLVARHRRTAQRRRDLAYAVASCWAPSPLARRRRKLRARRRPCGLLSARRCAPGVRPFRATLLLAPRRRSGDWRFFARSPSLRDLAQGPGRRWSRSIRCIRSSRRIARAPVPTIRRTAAFSIRFTSILKISLARSAQRSNSTSERRRRFQCARRSITELSTR